MAHLVLVRGRHIPRQVRWFIEGWDGFKYVVNAEGQVVIKVPLGFVRDWRGKVLEEQAWNIARSIVEFVNTSYDSLSEAVDSWISLGFVRWADDRMEIDEQPADYISPDRAFFGDFGGYNE